MMVLALVNPYIFGLHLTITCYSTILSKTQKKKLPTIPEDNFMVIAIQNITKNGRHLIHTTNKQFGYNYI
jgi:hypothetical protein